MDNTSFFKITEASKMLNIPTKTLVRLCNSGLVPHVRRDKRGHRILNDYQINHARIILGLRQAGLKKSELKHYTNLVRSGSGTLPERKAILETEKRQAWQRLEDIQHDIDFMERQIELIDQELAKSTQVER